MRLFFCDWLEGNISSLLAVLFSESRLQETQIHLDLQNCNFTEVIWDLSVQKSERMRTESFALTRELWVKVGNKNKTTS